MCEHRAKRWADRAWRRGRLVLAAALILAFLAVACAKSRFESLSNTLSNDGGDREAQGYSLDSSSGAPFAHPVITVERVVVQTVVVEKPVEKVVQATPVVVADEEGVPAMVTTPDRKIITDADGEPDAHIDLDAHQRAHGPELIA